MDVKKAVFGFFHQDKSLGARSCDLAAQLGPDAPAGSGDQYRPAADDLSDFGNLGPQFLAAKKIFKLHSPKVTLRDASVNQLRERRQGPNRNLRLQTNRENSLHFGPRGTRYANENLVYLLNSHRLGQIADTAEHRHTTMRGTVRFRVVVQKRHGLAICIGVIHQPSDNRRSGIAGAHDKHALRRLPTKRAERPEKRFSEMQGSQEKLDKRPIQNEECEWKTLPVSRNRLDSHERERAANRRSLHDLNQLVISTVAERALVQTHKVKAKEAKSDHRRQGRSPRRKIPLQPVMQDPG
ncbi:MAG TPA: hypothetical protein VMJ93_11690 [Verrucomicrobiae bacterium]|nr:hypothetical protein [Verrucomicrobiae bacterium]